MRRLKTLKHSIVSGVFAACLIISGMALAAGDAKTAPEQDWPHKGPFGTYDIEALQRGYQVYRENCAACHGMKRVAYRNLAEIGFSEAEIKAIAAEYLYEDGPNDDGDMFERPGIPADYFKNPYPNDQAARAVNNGALPPDMSLIVKARAYGEDYIYALLTGYSEPPEGETLATGMYWNEYMAGNKIAMAAPLADGVITYSDGTVATLEMAAYDVSQFLTWASEPSADIRKKIGFKVIGYLTFLAILLYLAKRKLWRHIKAHNKKS